jgi:hypothetical protein
MMPWMISMIGHVTKVAVCAEIEPIGLMLSLLAMEALI